MKKFLLIPFALTTLVFSSFATEPSPLKAKSEQEASQNPEIKFIDGIVNDYNNGKYQSFLEKTHSDYEAANKKWKYNNILEERKKISSLVTDVGQKETALASNAFKNKNQILHDERDRQLLEVCKSYPNTAISHEVKDMIHFIPNKDEQESLDFITNISLKYKGSGKSYLENKLITIDTEFWLKSISLETALSQNKIDEETYKKQSLVLQIEKLRLMKAASISDQNEPKIAELVSTAYAIYPKVNASTLTRKHLFALGKGKVQPQNLAEEKMQKIMAQYLEKEEQLINEYFP